MPGIPEHLAKLYDEKLSALLEKKPTVQDPLPMHHANANKLTKVCE